MMMMMIMIVTAILATMVARMTLTMKTVQARMTGALSHPDTVRGLLGFRV
jgi:hypothetical protein